VLQLFTDVLLSLIGFYLGGSSGDDTWRAAMMAIFVCEGAGKFYTRKMTNKMSSEWLRVFRKMNSSGVDGCVMHQLKVVRGFLKDLPTASGKPMNISLQIGDLIDSSPLATKRMATVLTLDGELKSIPNANEHMKPFTRTEERAVNFKLLFDTMISRLPRHGDNQADKISTTTVEGAKGSHRPIQVTTEIYNTGPFQLLAATNRQPSGDENEVFRSVGYALHILPAATDLVFFKPNERANTLRSQGQVTLSVNDDLYASFGAMFGIIPSIAAMHIALVNKSGVVPFNINRATLDLFDAMFRWFTRILKPLTFERNHELRFISGYLARGVASCVQNTLISSLQRAEYTKAVYEDVVTDTLLNLNHNALNTGDLISIMLTAITRALDPNLITVNFVFARELSTPVVDFEALMLFLSSSVDTVLTSNVAMIVNTRRELGVFFRKMLQFGHLQPHGGSACVPYLTSPINIGVKTGKNPLRMIVRSSHSDTPLSLCLKQLSDIIMKHPRYAAVLNSCGYEDATMLEYSLIASTKATFSVGALFREFYEDSLQFDIRSFGTLRDVFAKLSIVPPNPLDEKIGVSGSDIESCPSFVNTYESTNNCHNVGIAVNAISHIFLLSLVGSRELHSSCTEKMAMSIVSYLVRRLPKQVAGGSGPIAVRHLDVFSNDLYPVFRKIEETREELNSRPPYFYRRANEHFDLISNREQCRALPSHLAPFALEDYYEMRSMLQAMSSFGAVSLLKLWYRGFPCDFSLVRGRRYPLISCEKLASGITSHIALMTVHWDGDVEIEWLVLLLDYKTNWVLFLIDFY
jgi:hypothetical protein